MVIIIVRYLYATSVFRSAFISADKYDTVSLLQEQQ